VCIVVILSEANRAAENVFTDVCLSVCLSVCHTLMLLPRNIHSSSSVTISRPPSYSFLKITNRLFRFASPHLWNQLPVSFRQSNNQSPSHSPHFHSWQFMYIIVISTLLNSFSFSLSAQNLPFSQVFPTIDFWYLTP